MGPSRLSSHGQAGQQTSLLSQAGQQTSLLKDCKSFLRSAHLRLAACDVPYIFTRTRQQACIPRYAYQALLSQLFPEACAHTEMPEQPAQQLPILAKGDHQMTNWGGLPTKYTYIHVMHGLRPCCDIKVHNQSDWSSPHFALMDGLIVSRKEGFLHGHGRLAAGWKHLPLKVSEAGSSLQLPGRQ